MRKLVVIASLALITATSAFALEWHRACAYHARTDVNAKWALQDDGQGVYIKEWNSTASKPTKAELEAYDPAVIEAWENQSKQDKKTQAIKNREKKFKDLGLELGLTFPVQKGDLDTAIDNIMAAVEVDLEANNTKDAVRKLYKAVALLALRNELGDNVYDPLVGEGGE